MHSGLKSSFCMLTPTHLVPIEPVNVTLYRRYIMQIFLLIVLIGSINRLKCLLRSVGVHLVVKDLATLN